ncbi:MAG TPA: hypothetical protein VLA56_02625 [Pseudomonadales bacterium]|nr:hypothetical protein [Pseudomonadales bacterium]
MSGARLLQATLAVATTLLLAVGAGVHAEERLTLPSPQGWQTLSGLSAGRLRMSEFAVPGPDGAVDKLTFEWFDHSLAPGLDPLDIGARLAASLRPNCEDSSDQHVFAGMENGYPTVVRLLSCTKRRGSDQGEVLMLKAIRGQSGHWVLVRGRPVPAFERAAEPIDGSTVIAWTNAFRAITLCDPEQGDAHPCPATTAP